MNSNEIITWKFFKQLYKLINTNTIMKAKKNDQNHSWKGIKNELNSDQFIVWLPIFFGGILSIYNQIKLYLSIQLVDFVLLTNLYL